MNNNKNAKEYVVDLVISAIVISAIVGGIIGGIFILFNCTTIVDVLCAIVLGIYAILAIILLFALLTKN